MRRHGVRPLLAISATLAGGTPPKHNGRVQLVDGKLRARSNTTGNAATWTLHEGEGKRVLRIAKTTGASARS
jgi:hypothetical protein